MYLWSQRLLLSVFLVVLLTIRGFARMEASSADPSAPLLALPGPEFPRVNFDKAHDAGSTQECRSRSGGVPFTISGRNLYLVHDREIDSEDHAERTAGSIWDCSLVLAKYLARHTDQLIRGKRVIELGSGQVRCPNPPGAAARRSSFSALQGWLAGPLPVPHAL
jgi:hypothetical protein